jgi:hypothetical protein
MKTLYDQLAKLAGYQEGDRVWLYLPTRKRGKSPKLLICWVVSITLSLGSMKLNTGFSGIPRQKLWSSIWKSWRYT